MNNTLVFVLNKGNIKLLTCGSSETSSESVSMRETGRTILRDGFQSDAVKQF
ncbi:MAG: hypothetical protein WBL67_08290 [Nitrososphaeraceae archaeon]